MSEGKPNGCFVNLVQSMDHGYRTGDWDWYHKVSFSPDAAFLEDLFQALDDLGHNIYKRLQTNPAAPKAAAVADATDLKLRGECITTAIHMNKGLSVDLAIIEAEKLYQFLKGQHLAHGNKVH